MRDDFSRRLFLKTSSMAGAAVAFACPEGKRQKPKVGRGCSEGKRQKWEVDAQCLSASQWLVSLYLLPFTFCLLPFLVLFQSAIQNPKSRIQNRVSALRRS